MTGKQGQVMWPRLVANKILRRTFGGKNFIADDNSTNFIHSFDRHNKTHKYKVFVSTWNVGGVTPDDNLDMGDWLDKSNPPFDIYVLGFQEVVPLRAENVFGLENSKISGKWNDLIGKTLNKKTKNLCEKDGNDPRDFRCIISKKMVGILISVWVRIDHIPFIRNTSVCCVGCGIMGCLGDKGSVSVRFRLHETSFCFVCTHLASGGKQGDEKRRNSNAIEILSRTTFPRGSSLYFPRKIIDHDLVILLGDLNYRISLPEATTRSLASGREWNLLFEKDQLTKELEEGQVFEGWQESKITFAPTYKYFPNSDAYYGCIQGENCKKWRAPAWCDRIIWHGKGIKQHTYTRGESKLSDHRPVKGIFTVEVGVSRVQRRPKRFFLSDSLVLGK